MHVKRNAARPLFGLLMLSILFGVLVAGCGGDEDQSGGRQGGKASKMDRQDNKIALGTIRAVKEDKRRISLKPTTEDQGAKPLDFKVGKRTRITLAGEKQEIGDIKGGQQAQIEYIEKKGPNRAISVSLFPLARQPSDGQSQGGERTN